MIGKRLHGSEEEVAIDLSPMIDCIFILLIFFIVTTVFVEDPGTKVNKPELRGIQRLEKNSLLFAVTADNKIAYGGKIVSLQGAGGIVKQALISNPDFPIIIQGDAMATHGTIQRLHAEAKLAGATKVSVSAQMDSLF